jgi:hypothetical protein
MLTQSELSQFTGTENHYKHPLGILYTDGVKYLAKEAGCYWLLDIIASYYPQIRNNVRLSEFCLWQAEVKDDGAVISAKEDTGDPSFLEQHIDYAELPFNIKLYQCGKVVMLPSEY